MYSLSREDLNEAVWEGVISASVAESLRVYMYQIAADRPVQEDGINEAAAEGRLREMVRRQVVAQLADYEDRIFDLIALQLETLRKLVVESKSLSICQAVR